MRDPLPRVGAAFAILLLVVVALVVALALVLLGRDVEAAVGGAVAVGGAAVAVRKAKKDARQRDVEELAAVEALQARAGAVSEPNPHEDAAELLKRLEEASRARRRGRP
tara:strand:- start:7 stop:333 length:327 start_codon:yes stop_codon:yes gene_type:complete